MNYTRHKHTIYVVLLSIQTCFLIQIRAQPSAESYDYSHRKRDCEIKLLNSEGEPLAGAMVGIAQISNDFAFGGTIRCGGFDSLGDEYGERFLSYFDVATPENEMTWEYVMKCSEKCNPDFSKADFLVSWLLENKISICGNNLFSNGNEEQIPEWTRNLETAPFTQAMQERIDTAMNHFRGKVAQWDLITEICHGENGMIENKSGDPNIFRWIMDEARKIDPDADFIINDYNLITSNDLTTVDQFINKVKPLSSKFEIIGTEGHFGINMNKSSYEPKINYLAEQLGKPVWLTDVDFEVDTSQTPDKLEELMRTCFANPNVGGLIMGSWCRHYLSHNDITSYFVDSLNNETSVGQRWREVRAEWKTPDIAGFTDESGKFTFNGFQGKYLIIISCYTDTFYLEPGKDTQSVEVTYLAEATANHRLASLKTTIISINGIVVPIKLPAGYNRQLFLTIYSLSGQQLFRSPVNQQDGKYRVSPASSSCQVFRIETADRLPLYTGKIMEAR